jgi:hypothetical protein
MAWNRGYLKRVGTVDTYRMLGTGDIYKYMGTQDIFYSDIAVCLSQKYLKLFAKGQTYTD